jgi:hypothetical protein
VGHFQVREIFWYANDLPSQNFFQPVVVQGCVEHPARADRDGSTISKNEARPIVKRDHGREEKEQGARHEALLKSVNNHGLSKKPN